MRSLLVAAVLSLVVAPGAALAQSDHSVSGYVKKDGTYVAPHRQTDPNETKNDNYSTRGNVNPYTGQAGTKPRDGETTGYGTGTTQRSNPYGTTPTYQPYGSTSGSSTTPKRNPYGY